MSDQRCENCRFWVRGEHALYPLAYKMESGECCRFPPTLRLAVGDNQSNRSERSRKTSPDFVFPTVYEMMWCGEWQGKDSPPRRTAATMTPAEFVREVLATPFSETPILDAMIDGVRQGKEQNTTHGETTCNADA